MRKEKLRWLFVPAVLAAVMAVSGCGKNNVFSWAHSPGSDTSSAALSSDGHTALVNRDYARAIEYYGKVLDQDPNNSEAIYGYSAATLGNAGLDMTSLVTNLVGSSGPGAPERGALAAAVARAAGVYPSGTLVPGGMIDRLESIKPAVDAVLNNDGLWRIITGRCDRKIAWDNPDVNLNIAVCLLISAALDVVNYVNINSDYSVTKVPDTTADDTLLIRAARKIASAYFRLEIVADKLHLADSSTLGSIRQNVQNMFIEFCSDLSISVALEDYYYQGGLSNL